MWTLLAMLLPYAGIDYSVASCGAGATGRSSSHNLRCGVAQFHVTLFDVV